MDPPTQVLWIELCTDFKRARSREAQIKKWSRAKKGSARRQQHPAPKNAQS
jgi:predicted GIY-YIG superfamily endonuclease